MKGDTTLLFKVATKVMHEIDSLVKTLNVELLRNKLIACSLFGF